MDEFDKIREFSEDIANRKEPTLSLDVEVKEEVVETDDASLYDFTAEYAERPAYDPMNDFEEKKFSSIYGLSGKRFGRDSGLFYYRNEKQVSGK